MKTLAPSLTALALLIAPLTASAQSAPAIVRQALAQTALVGADRTQALAQASAALNRIASVQGRFAQIAPDGTRSQGDIYLQRPGRMRFQYDAPSPLTIVSDGSIVSVEDRSVRDVSRVPLRSPDGQVMLYPTAGGSPIAVNGLGPDELPSGWTGDGRAPGGVFLRNVLAAA